MYRAFFAASFTASKLSLSAISSHKCFLEQQSFFISSMVSSLSFMADLSMRVFHARLRCRLLRVLHGCSGYRSCTGYRYFVRGGFGMLVSHFVAAQEEHNAHH
jgi:hypothetical protein